MLLAIDVGNTNMVLGAYEGRSLRAHWRIETAPRRTFDEHGILILQLFAHATLAPARVRAIAVSSVVPALQFNLERMSEILQRQAPVRRTRSEDGHADSLRQSTEVGADRGECRQLTSGNKGALIVVDFGTATTFDAVTAKGE